MGVAQTQPSENEVELWNTKRLISVKLIAKARTVMNQMCDDKWYYRYIIARKIQVWGDNNSTLDSSFLCTLDWHW